MRLRFASAALDRMAMTLTARQNGLTAGPVLHAKWDLSDEVIPAPSGRIAIAVDRSTVQVAPDSVRFSVRIGEGAFAVPGPAPGAFYDPRLHDLIYLWDFGETEDGAWTAPENVLPSWKNRRYAKGPWVSHVFRTPGTKTVSVLVIDPATGDRHTDIVTFEIRDADLFYSAANPWGFADCKTYVINPTGDADFTGKPAGAIEHNATTTHHLGLPGRNGGPRRYLFKRGAAFNFGIEINDGDAPHIFFGAYGAGTDPILNCPGADENGGENTVFKIEGAWATSLFPASPDFRLENLNIVGRYDPTTQLQSTPGTGAGTRAIYSFRSMDGVISSCTTAGFRSTNFSQRNSAIGTTIKTPNHNHFDNYITTDMGGQYPHLWNGVNLSSFSVSFTGCRLMQNPAAYSQGLGDRDDTRALFRINSCTHIHMRGCDGFSTTQNNSTMKFLETPINDGGIVNVHSSSVESPDLALMAVGSNLPKNAAKRSVEVNAIFDGIIAVGGFKTGRFMIFRVTGVTVRNCLFIIPDTPSDVRFSTGFEIDIVRNIADGIALPPRVMDAPIRIYSNTMRFDRPVAKNGNNGAIPQLFTVTSVDVPYTNTVFANNVLEGHWAGQSGDGEGSPFAPLSVTTPWTPRLQGLRSTTFVLDTTFTPPPNAVKQSAPLPGSAALGEALDGLVSHMDIDLRFRPAYPSKGAWEMPEE